MENSLRTDLLPTSLPLFWLLLATVLCVSTWIGIHCVFHRQKRPAFLHFVAGFPLGAMACYLALQVFARTLYIASPWTLWLLSILTAFAVEAVILIYQHERALCPPKIRHAIFSLRLVAVLILCTILTQPVLQREKEHRIRRRVVVLLDDSQSMQRVDSLWTPSEALDVAQSLGTLPLTARPLRFAAASNAVLRTQMAFWAEQFSGDSPLESKQDLKAFKRDLIQATNWLHQTSAALTDLAQQVPTDPTATSPADLEQLRSCQQFLTTQLTPALANLIPPSNPKLESTTTSSNFATLEGALESFRSLLPEVSVAADRRFLATRSADVRAAISNACAQSRLTLAREILAQNLQPLQDRYDLNFYHFASTPRQITAALAVSNSTPQRASALASTNTITQTSVPTDNRLAAAPQPVASAEPSSTDFTFALESILQEIPSEERAGFLFLTDGRHTSDTGVEAVAKALGQSHTPVSTVLIGGTSAPFDYAIHSVRARESVFLGDRVRLHVTVAASQAHGTHSQITLLRDGKSVDSKPLEPQGPVWQEEIRLEDTPDTRGNYHYTVKIEADAREITDANNVWEFPVAVSDNRTHVLLADRRPRWEFRYLRNLFYGRDKSIHLQYYLSEPDTIRGILPPKPIPPASASRPFGEAEASALPESLEEWRKFDVIILGDLSEKELTPFAVQCIQHCVESRGASLVCIGGPHAMPFAFSNTTFKALMPAEWIPAATNTTALSSPYSTTPFRVEMAHSGRSHEIMSLSSSQMENESLWAQQPLWMGRTPVTKLKSGAEIIALAAPEKSEEEDATFTLDATAAVSPEAAVEAFALRRQKETEQAIVVAQTYGAGKVLLLLTDQSWRLRYQMGDTYHHRFWGQIMRWAAGEQLRAGNTFARLGTDQISYTTGEPVRIRARFTDRNFKALVALHPTAILSDAQNTPLAEVPLSFLENSNGNYEGLFQSTLTPGVYQIKLEVPKLEQILKDDFPQALECQFTVVTARQPRESALLTADAKVPRILALHSGGHVVSPLEAKSIVNDFGEPSHTRVEVLEIPLWASPLLFVLFLLAITAEWILRKKGGLA